MTKNTVNKLQDTILDLKQTLRDKDDFLSYAHHEIKSFIHSIYFISDYLNDYWHSINPLEAQQHISTILESTECLKLMSEDLFDLSRLNSGALSFDMGNIDLLELITDTIKHCRKIFLFKRELSISFDHDQISTAYVNCDKSKIKQVLLNLIINAIKYTDKGDIVINLCMLKINDINHWQFSISDQGIGIPEGELEAIFKPYFRSSKTNKSTPGSGLGLAICQQIITHHKGIINATNNEDKGATFSFAIPAL